MRSLHLKCNVQYQLYLFFKWETFLILQIWLFTHILYKRFTVGSGH